MKPKALCALMVLAMAAVGCQTTPHLFSSHDVRHVPVQSEYGTPDFSPAHAARPANLTVSLSRQGKDADSTEILELARAFIEESGTFYIVESPVPAKIRVEVVEGAHKESTAEDGIPHTKRPIQMVMSLRGHGVMVKPIEADGTAYLTAKPDYFKFEQSRLSLAEANRQSYETMLRAMAVELQRRVGGHNPVL